jgi:hypothetical protein
MDPYAAIQGEREREMEVEQIGVPVGRLSRGIELQVPLLYKFYVSLWAK